MSTPEGGTGGWRSGRKMQKGGNHDPWHPDRPDSGNSQERAPLIVLAIIFHIVIPVPASYRLEPTSLSHCSGSPFFRCKIPRENEKSKEWTCHTPRVRDSQSPIPAGGSEWCLTTPGTARARGIGELMQVAADVHIQLFSFQDNDPANGTTKKLDK